MRRRVGLRSNGIAIADGPRRRDRVADEAAALGGDEGGPQCRSLFLMRLHGFGGEDVGVAWRTSGDFRQAAGEQQTLCRSQPFAQYFVDGIDAEDDAFERGPQDRAPIVREIEPREEPRNDGFQYGARSPERNGRTLQPAAPGATWAASSAARAKRFSFGSSPISSAKIQSSEAPALLVGPPTTNVVSSAG